MITATRYHDISCGHRVHGHESKCAHLHGHNYRVHFTVVAAVGNSQSPVLAAQAAGAGLDLLGRVMDFSVIKSRLCMWLEDAWDHRMLIYVHDPMVEALRALDSTVVVVPFNPTAEHMAQFLGTVLGPQQLAGTGCVLTEVTIDETRKCSATWRLRDELPHPVEP